MLQPHPPTAQQGDVISLRLIDGTEIVCQFISLSDNGYHVKNPVKITISEDENVNASAFMAGLGPNNSATIPKSHVTVFAKTQETLKTSYSKLIGDNNNESNN